MYDYFLNTFKEDQSTPTTLSLEMSKTIAANRIYIDPTSQSLYFKSVTGAPTPNQPEDSLKPVLRPQIQRNEQTGELTVSIPNAGGSLNLEAQMYNSDDGLRIVISPKRNDRYGN